MHDAKQLFKETINDGKNYHDKQVICKKQIFYRTYFEGSSGNPNGRLLGSNNQLTTLKSAFIETFEELGGVDNLVEWAKYNQTNFHKILALLMPREIHASENNGVSLVECLREIAEREAQAE